MLEPREGIHHASINRKLEWSKSSDPAAYCLTLPEREGASLAHTLRSRRLAGIYTFDDGLMVYEITVLEPNDANADWLTHEDFQILLVDTWTLGKGRKTSKRHFTKEGKRVLEAQMTRMRENVRDPEQARHVERCILGLTTGRYLSELPPDPVLPTLDQLPIIDLEQEPI